MCALRAEGLQTVPERARQDEERRVVKLNFELADNNRAPHSNDPGTEMGENVKCIIKRLSYVLDTSYNLRRRHGEC